MLGNRQAHQELRTIIAVAAGRAVSALIKLVRDPSAKRAAVLASVLVGLLVQVGLVLVSMYLIDLTISLCELWADLARKHLELTL